MRRIITILSENRLLVFILLIGFFLRFYQFTGFVTFLGDQGRDAIILKRILTFEHLPAIGPPSSVGQVYLGPFYYYFIAPWLLFFNFNPVGPAFGVALFSCLYLLVNYLITKELIDKKTALISTFFLSFSSVLIEFSRFSWNPNLLPLFILLTIYFLIKSQQTNHWFFFALFGAFFSFSMQLHYLVLFFIPAIIFIYGFYLVKNLKDKKKVIINFSFLIFTFLFFSFPLIIFDLRHQFLNAKNFFKLFQETGSDLTTKITSLFESFYFLNLYAFHIKLNKFLIFIFFLTLLISFVVLRKEKSNIKIFIFFLVSKILFMSFYTGPKHSHYFGTLYPIYYIVTAYFLKCSLNLKLGKLLITVFIIGFILLNFNKFPYFFNKPSYQVAKAEKIAKIIYNNVKKKKFNITALPQRYSDSTYRYFLEIWGKRPIEKDSLIKADELFLVCEQKCAPIIGNPQWDIAYFAPTKIHNEWEVNGVKIYKLVR